MVVFLKVGAAIWADTVVDPSQKKKKENFGLLTNEQRLGIFAALPPGYIMRASRHFGAFPRLP